MGGHAGKGEIRRVFPWDERGPKEDSSAHRKNTTRESRLKAEGGEKRKVI